MDFDALIWKDKKNHATGATKACNYLIISESTVQDWPKNRATIVLLIVLLKRFFPSKRVYLTLMQISSYVDGDIFFASKEIFLTG